MTDRMELLHELFEQAVDRNPDQTAIVCGNVRLTYRELDEQSNQLAHALRLRGVRRENRVAIFLPRSHGMYIAMLAILKAGAAYVPLDPDIPLDRARFILQDCGAQCLITEPTLGGALLDVVPLVYLGQEMAIHETTRLTRAITEATSENLCYLIYTSGTTGQPKGVQIEHRNAAHLIHAESQLFGILPQDRIFQLASIAFDASIEEIWMAFYHGATLIVGTLDIVHSGADFPAKLASLGVTVLSCVPTFLSMVDHDIPTLRLLILGGEVCPSELAARWVRPGRAVFNTYGPTEATVIATAALLAPGKPVTIGRAIHGTEIFLVNEKGQPSRADEPGELYIAGPGIARGYLNRPELQKQLFVTTDALTGAPLRCYRTGDLARLTPDGDYDYVGRIDDQVKVRGYRIELTEIESALSNDPGILAAAASVHKATQRIAAYIVLRAGHTIDRAALRRTLHERLPVYMVPAFLDELPALPMTTSGKIDRRQLPDPILPLSDEKGKRVPPRTDAEHVVLEVWSSVLKQTDLSVYDDFFLDLGGHSLLAAMVVSQLRRQAEFKHISVADLYAHTTAESLAALAKTSQAEPATLFHRVSRWTYAACAAGQGVGIFLLAGVYAWQWLGAFLTYGYLAVADWPVRQALCGALVVYLIMTPAILALSIAVKWLLLGRIQPGRYPLWGWFYWRFWFVRTLVRATPVPYLSGTPFINLYYRLMGARIGRDVYIGSTGLATFDVLTVGDGSSIGTDTSLDGASVEGGWLKIAPVTVGRNCWVGNRCSLGARTVLEDGAGIDDLSMLPDDTRVPAGQLWRGSPAHAAGAMNSEVQRAPWSAACTLAQLAGILVFPLITLAGIFPGLMAIVYIGHKDPGYFFLFASPLVALSFVIFLCAEVWAIKWLLLGRMRPGRYRLGGWFYVRLWFFDQLMDLSLEVIGTFYTTLYLAPWLKALGARIGPRSEISTIRLIHPDLLSTGPECFLADDVMVGTPRVRAGWISIGRARLGRRVFVGNSAVLPAEVRLAEQVLVGALSIAPLGKANPVPAGSSWFGSPPIFLPARQMPEGFSEEQTYHPAPRLVALRLLIEFFRIILPSTLFVILASLIVNVTDIMQDHVGLKIWLATLPVLYVLAGILSILVTLILKAVLIGRYREDQKPLWSSFVWRTELLTGVYENLCVLFFLNLLRGTPFIAWVLRLFGMKVGKRCYIDTTWFTEFDLVTIENEAALNEDANIQTHLFEDRVMKMGKVFIGRRASVGTMSTVLYHTAIGEAASLGELSLLMKGETLPDGTRWHGSPAQSY